MNKFSLVFIGVLLAAPLLAHAEDSGFQVQQSIPFATNAYKLGPTGEKKLREDVESLAVLLRYRPESSIEIAGYADPSEKKPGPLADQRAQRVWEHLIALGLPAERMEPVGHGAAKGGSRVDIRISAEDALAMSQYAQPMPTPKGETTTVVPTTPAEPVPAPSPPPAVAATPSAPEVAPTESAPSRAERAEQAAQAKRDAEEAKRQAAEAKRQAGEQAAADKRAKVEQAAAERKAAQEAALERQQAAAELKRQQALEKQQAAAELKRQQAEAAEAARQAKLKAAEERKAAQQAELQRKQAEAEAKRQAQADAREKAKQAALEKKQAAEAANKAAEAAKIQQAMATPPPTLTPEATDKALTQKGKKIVDNQLNASYVAPPSVTKPTKSALPGEGLYFIQGTAYFSANARTLTPGSSGTIDALAIRVQKLIQQRPNARIDVVGHADPITESAQADVLAEGRAEELMKELVARGVDRTHLHAAGASDTQPLTSKKGDPARNLNMRAEIRIPNGG